MMVNINMGVWGIRHCFKAKLPYPLVCIRNFFDRDETFKTSPFPQIFRLRPNFTVKYESSWNLSSENLKLKLIANQKLRAVKEGTPDISMVFPFTFRKFPQR